MTIYVVNETHEGAIIFATSEKAAKRALIKTGWVECDVENVWVKDETRNGGGYWASLKELYGERWKEEFMKLDTNGLHDMGFRIDEEELREEE